MIEAEYDEILVTCNRCGFQRAMTFEHPISDELAFHDALQTIGPCTQCAYEIATVHARLIPPDDSAGSEYDELHRKRMERSSGETN